MRYWLTLLQAVLFSWSLTVFASPPATSSEPLRVGSAGDYPPLTLQKPDGTWEGFAIDMARNLAKHLDRELELVKTSWPTLHADLTAGKFDLAMGGISFTEGRSQQFLMSETVFEDGKVALANCQLHPYLYFYSVADLLTLLNQPLACGSPLLMDTVLTPKQQYWMGVKCGGTKPPDNVPFEFLHPPVQVVENPGGTNELLARQWLPKAAITIAHDNVEPFRTLVELKAHVMITDRVEALYKSRVMPELCVINPDAPFNRSPKVYMTRKESKALMQEVNDWLGEVDKTLIQSHWF